MAVALSGFFVRSEDKETISTSDFSVSAQMTRYKDLIVTYDPERSFFVSSSKELIEDQANADLLNNFGIKGFSFFDGDIFQTELNDWDSGYNNLVLRSMQSSFTDFREAFLFAVRYHFSTKLEEQAATYFDKAGIEKGDTVYAILAKGDTSKYDETGNQADDLAPVSV